jgi:hypothetical protein
MDIEANLAWLARLPTPELAGFDGAELAQRARAESRGTRVTLAMALTGSLAIGVAGGMQMAPPEDAPLVAFGPSQTLTPLIALGQQ